MDPDDGDRLTVERMAVVYPAATQRRRDRAVDLGRGLPKLSTEEFEEFRSTALRFIEASPHPLTAREIAQATGHPTKRVEAYLPFWEEPHGLVCDANGRYWSILAGSSDGEPELGFSPPAGAGTDPERTAKSREFLRLVADQRVPVEVLAVKLGVPEDKVRTQVPAVARRVLPDGDEAAGYFAGPEWATAGTADIGPTQQRSQR